MQVKLRPVGNSIGITIPASELRAVEAKAGDMVELEIKRVIRGARAGWDDPTLWPGANDEPLLLDGAPESAFDTEEWKW